MIKRKIYIILFSILYLGIALVSTVHAVSFFSLANVLWMGIMLAGMFEIGQAAVLFSLLSSKKERSKTMPWCLMIILTLVQVMGNVFSSYKYVMLNSSDDIRFFTEPILFFMESGDPLVNVILTYIIGAILPIVALCLTSMLVHHLEDIEVTKRITNNDASIREPDNNSNSDAEEIMSEINSDQSAEEQPKEQDASDNKLTKTIFK